MTLDELQEIEQPDHVPPDPGLLAREKYPDLKEELELPPIDSLPKDIRELVYSYMELARTSGARLGYEQGFTEATDWETAYRRSSIYFANQSRQAVEYLNHLKEQGKIQDAEDFKRIMVERGVFADPEWTPPERPKPVFKGPDLSPEEIRAQVAAEWEQYAPQPQAPNRQEILQDNKEVPQQTTPSPTIGKRSRVVTTKSREQRADELEALQSRIRVQVEQIRDSQGWRDWLTYAASFHTYSFRNICLIKAQMPHASLLAGYRMWQEKGRQVNKGERGIRIIGGKKNTRTTTDETTGEEKIESFMTYFPCSVFDISQTTIVDETKAPQEITRRLTGEDTLGIYEATEGYLKGIGWTIERRSIPGKMNGYTTHSQQLIVIDENLSPAQAAKTMLHEAAHALMHDTLTPQAYVEHRGEYEVEAESVAYLTANVLGMDTSEYSVGYIAGWSKGDSALIEHTGKRVLATSRRLVEAISDYQPDERSSQEASSLTVEQEHTQTRTERVHVLAGVGQRPNLRRSANTEHGGDYTIATSSPKPVVIAQVQHHTL